MNELEQYIQSYFGIPASHLASIASLFEQRHLEKGDYLLKSGGYSDSLCFVREGYLRMYALDSNGNKEITQWISTPSSFAADLSSYMFGTPSRWNIQALTECEMYTLTAENYKKIGNLVTTWSELEKLFIAKCFVALENRVFSQLSMSSEDRYDVLYAQSPELFNNVPLQYIASMMGMSPETLSRIRNKKIS